MTSLRLAQLFLGALAVACTKDAFQSSPAFQYDPYVGVAYPNMRQKIVRPAGDLGLTVDVGSDTVTVIDFVAGKVIASLPVGLDPIDNDGPHDIAVDDKSGFAYIALSYPAPAFAAGPHAAHGSSVRDGFLQKLALDDLRIVGEVRVDPNANELHVSDDGSRIVNTHFDLLRALVPGASLDARRANIAVTDPQQVLAIGSADPVMIPTCIAPHDLALSSPDGRLAYVACYGEDAVAVVDTTNPRAPVLRVPVGGTPGTPGSPTYGPYSIEMSPSGRWLYIGDSESHDARFFDTATNAFTSVVTLLRGVPGIASWSDDESTLYVAVQAPDELIAIDPKTGAITKMRGFDADTCLAAHGAILASDPASLYVICEGNHTDPGWILVVDRTTFDTKAKIVVGVYPNELEILGGGP